MSHPSLVHEIEYLPTAASADHPLERIYLCERDQANEPLLSQPQDGVLQTWTWAEAVREARSMAAWIRRQDWPAGSRIVILAKNSAWWIMADFAIWMSGHVSVPLFAATSEAQLVQIFAHCAPVACFVGQTEAPVPAAKDSLRGVAFIAFPNAGPAPLPPGALSWSDIVRETPPIPDNPTRNGRDAATIIYTSGTTGQPKGVMQTFECLALSALSLAPTFGKSNTRRDSMLSYLPLAHIAERCIVEATCLFLPMHIYFTESQATFLQDLQRARPTVFFSVPRLYIRLQQGVFEKLPQKKLAFLLKVPVIGKRIGRKVLRGLGLDQARIMASGSAPIPGEIIEWYRSLGADFVEGYGMTETGITHVPKPHRSRIGSVGHASDYAATRISAGGEVQIQGPMNMLGYYRNPELTASVFTSDGYFCTGDRGEIDPDGRLRILGRLKEEFKTSKGKYVVPAQIEKIIACSPMYESVALFGANMVAPFPLLVLVPEKRAQAQTPAGRSAVEAQLIADMERINAQVEHHERLRFVAVAMKPWTVDNGLLTPTAKVRRPLIEERYGAQFAVWEASQQKVVWVEE